MNELKVFESNEFGSVRTTVVDGEIMFVGKDVAEILGYTNVSKALSDHVDNEDKLNNESLSSLGQRGGWLINESGLYSLILSSKMPNAKQFKRWVTSEVLPTLRKTGGYINNSELFVNTYFGNIPDDQKTLVLGLVHNIEAQQKQITSITNENNLLVEKRLEWADRSLINALVRKYAVSLNGDFAKAWVSFKKELLYKYGVNLQSRITNYINDNCKKPKTLDMLHDDELAQAISTIVAMCKEDNIDISDIINNKAKTQTA